VRAKKAEWAQQWKGWKHSWRGSRTDSSGVSQKDYECISGRKFPNFHKIKPKLVIKFINDYEFFAALGYLNADAGSVSRQ
jgi:hypothetical protein